MGSLALRITVLPPGDVTNNAAVPDPTYPNNALAYPPSLRGQTIELAPSRGFVLAALEVALADPAYRRYSSLPAAAGASEVAAVREERAGRGDAAYWALLDPEAQICGIFELTFRDRVAGILEAGYWVAEQARGRGYAPEALSLVTDWVETAEAALRIELAIYPANTASLRVAEKAGYTRRGATTPSVPGAPRDEFPELYVWERMRS